MSDRKERSDKGLSRGSYKEKWQQDRDSDFRDQMKRKAAEVVIDVARDVGRAILDAFLNRRGR